jgi:large subunit ribosomal protein L17
MRHRKAGKKLGRDKAHRKALLKNLARSFFEADGEIQTTEAKAKAVQPLIEKMINKTKQGDVNARRWLNKYFQDEEFVNQVVEDFGKKFKDRQGGYTRRIKVKRRQGDGALVVKLQAVEK